MSQLCNINFMTNLIIKYGIYLHNEGKGEKYGKKTSLHV